MGPHNILSNTNLVNKTSKKKHQPSQVLHIIKDHILSVSYINACPASAHTNYSTNSKNVV